MPPKSVLALLGVLTLTAACGAPRTAATSPAANSTSMPTTSAPTALSTPAPAASQPWPRATNFVFDSTRQEIVLFGGLGATIDDTWTWNGHQWTLHPQPAPASSGRTTIGKPPGRSGAALADDPVHGVVVMFGGGDRNDTWLWNGSIWTQALPEHSPSSQTGAAFVWDPVHHVDLLFGRGETWTWNGADWTQLAPANSPPARDYARIAFDVARGKAVLFGGFEHFNDAWTWDGSTWTQQHPATMPPGLTEATPVPEQMAYDPIHQVVVMVDQAIHGAYTADWTMETWVWDGSNWNHLSPAAKLPPRDGSGTAFDPATGLTVWAGGLAYGNGDASSTWGWDGTNWKVIG